MSQCSDRRSVGLTVLMSGTLLGRRTRLFFFLSFASQLLSSSPWGTLSDQRTGLQICRAICQCSELWRTHNHTLLSHLRLLGSLSVASYDWQELRWKYFNPPPHRGFYEIVIHVLILLKNWHAEFSRSEHASSLLYAYITLTKTIQQRQYCGQIAYLHPQT
jgi:hypothetical protein